ncbi:tetratricopeptide repeat protein [Aquimarina sp. 2201CG5-10]|uniref:tetratricopeptide repeat protein n=1 Tax=Aquimarina callyspongiae TaxID=3098150 RepID=UPI002AB3F7F5|nr:tetratricopeptide repeat protein [Aquimarina sp. 2201CG5-10]MDY8138033.1 tetratricopeptide repeat protein [Aquimarina sp. 2201CG5-10]
MICISSGSFSQEKDTTLVSLEERLKKSNTDSLRVEALLNLGVYQLRRDFNKVETYANQIQEILKKANLGYDINRQRAELFQQLGILYRKRAQYGKAMKYYLDAQKIFLEYNDSLNLSSNYHNIGNVFKYQKEYRKSINVFKKAIAINESLGIPKKIGDNYNAIGGSYRRIGKIDSASYFLEEAYQKYEQAGYEEGKYRAIANKSQILNIQNKHTEALDLQLEYLAYVEKKEIKESTATANYNLAGTYNNLGKFNKAISHVDQSIAIAIKEKMGRRLAVSYKRKSLSYFKMKQFEDALEYYRKYAKANDSVFNLQKAKEIREIELQYEFEQQKLKDSIQFAEEKKRISTIAENQELKRKWYFTLLLITLFLTVLILYYGIRYFRKVWKQNQLRETTLTSQIEELHTEVSLKKEEVTDLMKETLIHLRTKEKIAEDLSKLSDQEEGISLKSIIAELKADKLEDTKLILLKKNIETLNYEFVKRLRIKHPSLTKTDIEVCSFIKLGLSRKEISNLRKTSLDAIKSTRFRLKKKLELSQEESLDSYIKNL